VSAEGGGGIRQLRIPKKKKKTKPTPKPTKKKKKKKPPQKREKKTPTGTIIAWGDSCSTAEEQDVHRRTERTRGVDLEILHMIGDGSRISTSGGRCKQLGLTELGRGT